MSCSVSQTILVLGGGGALGSAVASEAVRSGHKVHATLRPGGDRTRVPALEGCSLHECDLSHAGNLQALLELVQPELIVMSAAPGGHPPSPWQVRTDFLATVLGINLALFQACHAVACKVPLVWLNSSTVYGGGEPREPSSQMRPQTFRGAVKACDHLMASFLAEEQAVPLVEFRIFCAYGRWMPRTRLLSRLLQAALSGGTVALLPGPIPRDWIHHRDIGRAVLACLRTPWTPAERLVLNLCSGKLVDCRAVAERLSSCCGRNLIAPEPYPGNDLMGEVLPGIPPPREALAGWSPETSLEDGVSDLWQWASSPEGRNFLLAS